MTDATPRPPDIDQLRTMALRWLHRTDRSRRHMRDRLLERGGSPELVDSLLDDLQERGWLDDRRCAQSLARRWNRNGRLAPDAMSQRLEAEGIAADIAREVAECDDDRLPVDLAMEIAAKQLPRLERHPRDVIARRLQGLLARKGYEEDVVTEALERMKLIGR